MQAIIKIVFLSFFLTNSQIVFADDLFSNCSSNCTYHQHTTCASPEPQLDCNCTDPGMYYNTCMDKKHYCQVFGNVGAIN